MAQQLKAIVKSVLSGDTLVLRTRAGPVNGQAPKERVIHLSSVSAPRLGSQAREDEPYAFLSREFVRKLVVGQEVAFIVLNSVPGSGSDGPREYGTVLLAPAGPGQPARNLSHLLLAEGLARVRDNADESEVAALRPFETTAKEASKGVWCEGSDVNSRPEVNFQMVDSQAFLNDNRGKQLDAIVEGVRDGSTVRLRLLLPVEAQVVEGEGEGGASSSSTESAPQAFKHQFITLSLAGLKAPKTTSDPSAYTAEPLAEESKFFVESRLLQREVKAILISSPASIGQSPMPRPSGQQQAGSVLPPPTNSGQTAFFIGLVLAPQGSIGEYLVGAGLARVLDFHAGLIASFGGLDKLRANEKAAKEGRKGIWESLIVPTKLSGPSNGAGGSPASVPAPSQKGRTFSGQVVRVWSADQVSIIEEGQQQEKRVQLSSLRAPRVGDVKLAWWANEGKEFLRKKLIGKTVQVTIDYIKPAEGDFDEKTCVTIKFGGAHANVSELLIEKGFCSVLRHRKDDEDRSPEMEKLITAEQTALAESRGIHSQKDAPPLPRILDVSESGAKAAQFLPFFKRAGRQAAVVDFVAAGSRFKVLLPKEDKKLTFVLAGIRAPKTARNAGEKSEPFGVESHRFSLQYMQRDVEVEFESTDKTGGYVGNLYYNKLNVAVELVRAGLASVHAFSAEGLSTGKALMAAEEEAKSARRGVWGSYDPAVEEAEKALAAASLQPATALPTSYQDVLCTYVKLQYPHTFFVQFLNAANQNGQALEKLMTEFAAFHKLPTSKAPVGWTPKPGELVSGQFSEDGQWYRARAKRVSGMKKEAELVYIDYGNDEVVAFSSLRPLDSRFKSLPPQAQEAQLSFVKLVKPSSEYHAESLDRFRDLADGRKLIANVDYKEPSLQSPLIHLRLIDPKDPRTASDPLSSINSDLLRDGLASLDTSVRYLGAYKSLVSALETSTKLAKRERLGQYELGDVDED